MEKIEVKIIDLLESKWCGLFLFCIALISTFSLLFNDYTPLFKDIYFLRQIGSQESFTDFFSTSIFPMRDIIIFMQFNLFGEKYHFYKLINLFFHFLNTFGILYFLKKYYVQYKYLLATIFFISPIHLFSLFSPLGVDIILCSFFGGLSVYFYLKQLNHSKLFNINYLLCFSFLFLAQTTHYSLLGMPLIFLVINYFSRCDFKEQNLKAVPLFVYGAFRLIAIINNIKPLDIQKITLSEPNFLLAIGGKINHVVESIFLINNLSPLYSFDFLNIYALVVAIILFILLVATAFLKDKKSNILSCLFLLSLFPFFLNLSLEYDHISPFVDKYYYLLTFLLIILILNLVKKAYEKSVRFIPYFLVLYFFASTHGILNYQKVFTNPVDFYTKIIKKDPYNCYAFYKILELEVAAKNYEQALKTLDKYSQFIAFYPKSWNDQILEYIQILEDYRKRKGEMTRP